MQRRYSLAHFILAGVIVLGLAPPMVCVDAQAQIAFVSARDGNRQIYVMDADGKNQRRLTNNVWDDWFPSWSPDGERIVFNSRRDGNFRNDFGITDEIYVMDADGSNQQRLTENLFDDRDPSWSPDGERIVFSSRGHGPDEIYVMDADGSNQRRLTENLFDDRDPSWSPDGEWIAFVSDRDGLFNDEIYVMDADGSNQRRLTENLAIDWHPSWSPDGDRIAFSSFGEGNSEIYVMDADGKNQRRLTKNRQSDWHPSWSPDGEWIVFASDRNGNDEIYVMDADGGNRRNLTKNRGDDWHPSWFDPAFAVEIAPFAVGPAGKKLTMWGWLKQVGR